MPINIGTEGIGEIYVGTESIGQVYVGTELVWQKIVAIMFNALASYTGGQVSAATTSVATSTISTAGSSEAWTVVSVDTFANNNATDGQSTLTSTTLSPTVSTVDVGSPGTFSPATSQVPSGVGFTQSASQPTQITTTPRTRYINTVTVSPVSTSATTRTPSARGTVPAGYIDTDDPIVIQVSVPQSGDTANPAPNQTSPGGTVLTPGNNVVENGTPVVTTGSRTVTQGATGSGTYSFTVSGEANPTNGDTDTYTITSIDTNNSGPDTNYLWSVSGGTINSGNGTTSISVTWNTVGGGSVSASNSFAGFAGTFSASDTLNVTVASSNTPGTGSFDFGSFQFPYTGVGTYNISGLSVGDETFINVSSTSGAWRLVSSNTGVLSCTDDCSDSVAANENEPTLTVNGTGTGTITLEVVGSDGSTYSSVASFSFSVT